MFVWKRCYLQDAGVHGVHETFCREWSHDKKKIKKSASIQHTVCFVTCWEQTELDLKQQQKLHWAPWKVVQDHVFKLSLTQDGWSSVYWMSLSFWRMGNQSVGEAYWHRRCWSASPPVQPPRPAQLLVHWHGIWRNASSLLQEKVCLGAGWRTLLSTCNPQKKRGSSTWAHSSSHHPYIMS